MQKSIPWWYPKEEEIEPMIEEYINNFHSINARGEFWRILHKEMVNFWPFRGCGKLAQLMENRYCFKKGTLAKDLDCYIYTQVNKETYGNTWDDYESPWRE